MSLSPPHNTQTQLAGRPHTKQSRRRSAIIHNKQHKQTKEQGKLTSEPQGCTANTIQNKKLGKGARISTSIERGKKKGM